MSTQLLEAVDKLNTQLDKRFDEFKENYAELSRRVQSLEQRTTGSAGAMYGAELGQRSADPAHAITKALQGSAEVKAFTEGKIRSAGVPIDAGLLRKNAILLPDAGVPAQRLTGIVTGPLRRVWLADLLPNLPVRTGAIEYQRESAFINAAAEVAEGALKPESALTLDVQSAPVRTVAHWIKLSKATLDDAPALTEHVGTRLLYGLRLKLENQLLTGNGVSPTLAGLLLAGNHAVHTATAGDTALDTLRRARAELETGDFEIDAFALHPRDLAAIDLLKDTGGAYIAGDPATGEVARLWGVPAVSTPAVAQGSFIAGAFGQAAMLFVRQDAVVELGYDGQDFTRNLVTMRCEMRVGLAVHLPAGIRFGQLTA